MLWLVWLDKKFQISFNRGGEIWEFSKKIGVKRNFGMLVSAFVIYFGRKRAVGILCLLVAQ